jgi:hypothetical protein
MKPPGQMTLTLTSELAEAGRTIPVDAAFQRLREELGLPHSGDE